MGFQKEVLLGGLILQKKNLALQRTCATSSRKLRDSVQLLGGRLLPLSDTLWHIKRPSTAKKRERHSSQTHRVHTAYETCMIPTPQAYPGHGTCYKILSYTNLPSRSCHEEGHAWLIMTIIDASPRFVGGASDEDASGPVVRRVIYDKFCRMRDSLNLHQRS